MMPEATNPTDPLLPTAADEASSPLDGPVVGVSAVLMRLYVSHTLSAWNSRMFEFGAALFLASIFPGTLLYVSIYALVRAMAAVALSSLLGERVDRSDRLVAVRQSISTCKISFFFLELNSNTDLQIVWQRVPVAASCLCFGVLLAAKNSALTTTLLFTAVALLACIEKLASTANTVAVERDWVRLVLDYCVV